ncbi:MAG: DUF1538 domain-containing protein [Candidatus Izemoplasmatales bacterium]|nr:DUF1538 domain-containing protein [Acholeplasmataceae bacterium]
MQELGKKLKEVFFSILPIIVVVTMIHLFVEPLEPGMLGRFFLGAFFVWIGLSIFLFGVEVGISPVGELFGKTIAKSKNIWIIICGSFVLGFLITIAEPDLMIVGNMAEMITQGDVKQVALVVMVAAFFGIMIGVAIIRILFQIPLHLMFGITYLVVFILALFIVPELHGVAFDVSASSTGAITVPFLLAITLGVASMRRDGKSAETDSFGLVGMSTAGAIIACLIVLIASNPKTFSLEYQPSVSSHGFLETMLDAFLAIAPIFVITLISNFLFFKIKFRRFGRYLFGYFYSFIGLTLFLYGVYSGFLAVGTAIGQNVSGDSMFLVLTISFLLGVFAVLAEPAVYPLTNQIYEVTTGSVSKKLVLLSLSLGVGLALVLNVLRIQIEGFLLWHILLPGYLIAIVLMFVSPKMFVGMAFDAGGVASGPMSATFILAFSQGIAMGKGSTTLGIADAFGMIGLIAMMPVITIEILGVIYKVKARKRS